MGSLVGDANLPWNRFWVPEIMLLLRAFIPLVTKFPFFLVAWFQSDLQEYLRQYSLVSLSRSFEASIRPDGLCIPAKAYCSFTAKSLSSSYRNFTWIKSSFFTHALRISKSSIRPSSTALIGSILLELSFVLMQVPGNVLYKRKLQELKFFCLSQVPQSYISEVWIQHWSMLGLYVCQFKVRHACLSSHSSFTSKDLPPPAPSNWKIHNLTQKGVYWLHTSHFGHNSSMNSVNIATYGAFRHRQNIQSFGSNWFIIGPFDSTIDVSIANQNQLSVNNPFLSHLCQKLQQNDPQNFWTKIDIQYIQL